MKKVLLWGMIALLVLASAGCGGAPADGQTETADTTEAPAPTPAPTSVPTPALPPVLYLVDANGIALGEQIDVTAGGDSRAFVGFFTENTNGTGLTVRWDEDALAAQGIHAERSESPAGAYLTCQSTGRYTVQFFLSDTDAPAADAVTASVRLRAVGEVKDLSEYPYLDDDGYWHYRAELDGVQLPLAHDVLMPAGNNPYNEPLFPFSEILDYFGVAYYWNRTNDDFSTVINDVDMSHDCNDTKYFWFTTEQWGYHVTIGPQNIDGVYYTPYFVFDYTLGATVNKIKKGQEESTAVFSVTTNGAYQWGEGSTQVPIMRWNESAKEYTADPIADGV